MTAVVYRRRRRKPRRKKWPLILLAALLLVALLVGAVWIFGFNPLLERQLKTQLGDHFFTDFGDLSRSDNGEDPIGIVNNYEPAFQTLEDKAIERLEELYTTAVDEYFRQQREGTLDRFMLTNKYIQAGRILESSVDKVFYDLLDEMKAELSSKGFPTDAAAEIEAAYISVKNDKKLELLDRLRNKIGS